MICKMLSRRPLAHIADAGKGKKWTSLPSVYFCADRQLTIFHAKQAAFMTKLAQQEENMKRIMAEQDKERREKQLILSLKNEGVSLSVERSKRSDLSTC